MKKLLALLICLCLLPLCALAEKPLPEELLLPGRERIGEAEAVGIACAQMESLPGELTIRAELVRLTDNTHAWVVTARGDTGARTVMLSSEDGEVLWLEEAQVNTWPNTLARWEEAKGEWNRWSQEQLVMYSRLYEVQAAPVSARAEAVRMAMAALGLEDASAYRVLCSCVKDQWKIYFVQDGCTRWQVTVNSRDGQVQQILTDGGNG